MMPCDCCPEASTPAGTIVITRKHSDVPGIGRREELIQISCWHCGKILKPFRPKPKALLRTVPDMFIRHVADADDSIYGYMVDGHVTINVWRGTTQTAKLVPPPGGIVEIIALDR
jgi:hypothetical protein